MIRLANVLIVDEEYSRAEALALRLAHSGYHAAIVDAAGAVAMAGHDHPDLMLISEGPGLDAVALGRELKDRSATGDIPVLLLAEQVAPDLCSRAVEAGLDDVVAFDCGDVELSARMRPLVRLATMHAELRQRAQTAQAFGVSVRDRVETIVAASPAILVIGDNTEAVRPVLEGAGDVTFTENLFEAEDLLVRRNFDAAVLAFTVSSGAILGFCSQVRNNPRLFNLPMLLLVNDAGETTEAYRHGATRVLPQPVDPLVLRSAVLTLVRRQQLRWSIRTALNESLEAGTRDAVSGTYTRAFLDRYLASRLEVAKAQGRHLAVVFFAAPSIEGVRGQFGEDAALHLTQQLRQWIGGLLRAEDLTAATSPTEFCVVLPDTPLGEAEIVMHRIAGILAYTDFAVREVYQPVKVWVQVGCTASQPDDDVASLLARARRNLD